MLLRPPAPDRETHIANAVETTHVFNGTTFPIDEDRVRKQEGRYFDRGLSPTGTARQMAALLASGSRRELLQSVTVPTLIIHGDADPLSPIEGGRAAAETIPNGELLEIAGMGHYLPPVLWPQVIEAIVRHAV
jgi:pimeloyl-ACP methyl ester carboxylesterase